MLPDITGVGTYVGEQLATFIGIVLAILAIKAFLSERWGAFFSSLIFGVVCWIFVAMPEEFEKFAKGIWNLINGSLS